MCHWPSLVTLLACCDSAVRGRNLVALLVDWQPPFPLDPWTIGMPVNNRTDSGQFGQLPHCWTTLFNPSWQLLLEAPFVVAVLPSLIVYGLTVNLVVRVIIFDAMIGYW